MRGQLSLLGIALQDVRTFTGFTGHKAVRAQTTQLTAVRSSGRETHATTVLPNPYRSPRPEGHGDL